MLSFSQFTCRNSVHIRYWFTIIIIGYVFFFSPPSRPPHFHSVYQSH
jgi:hypothetical protein